MNLSFNIQRLVRVVGWDTKPETQFCIHNLQCVQKKCRMLFGVDSKDKSLDPKTKLTFDLFIGLVSWEGDVFIYFLKKLLRFK